MPFDIGPFRPVATGVPAALPGGPQIKDNGQYFNPAAFARTPQFQFGNVSRYLPDVRYPSNFGLNALIEKQLMMHERFKSGIPDRTIQCHELGEFCRTADVHHIERVRNGISYTSQ